ncbi:hypothetical protein YC2023_108039 [Brassica napus]
MDVDYGVGTEQMHTQDVCGCPYLFVICSSNYYRSWIDRPHLDTNTRLLTEEYQRGITEFMGLVQRQPEAETGMLRCPCSNCKNRKIIKEWDVWTHLYLNGFTQSYKIWYHHGKTDYEYGRISGSSGANLSLRLG